MKFRHKGLRQLYETGDAKGVTRHHSARIQRILTVLDNASDPSEANQPGFRLHRLTGTSEWSVRVSRNWRVVFRFADGEAVDVNLVDYH